MTQAQLDRAVAAATGESRRTIGELGFSLADPLETQFDPEPSDVARFLDWDRVPSRRYRRVRERLYVRRVDRHHRVKQKRQVDAL